MNAIERSMAKILPYGKPRKNILPKPISKDFGVRL